MSIKEWWSYENDFAGMQKAQEINVHHNRQYSKQNQTVMRMIITEYYQRKSSQRNPTRTYGIKKMVESIMATNFLARSTTRDPHTMNN
jgi:hypothetical protein